MCVEIIIASLISTAA